MTSTSTSTPTPKPLSISLGKAKSTPNTNPISGPSSSRRPQPALLTHHDSDSDGDNARPLLETVTHIDTAGATNGVRKEKEERKLVIQSQGNRDWRKRGRNLLPPEVQARQGRNGAEPSGDAARGEVETIEVAKEGGLKFAQKAEAAENGDTQDVAMDDADTQTKSEQEVVRRNPKTDDDRALEALLTNGSRPKSNLVIPQDDLSLFRSDVSTRPDAASLADYAAVPVEEFGAALLRGMGWKEGEEYSTKRKNRYASDAALNGENKKAKKEVERRPALLGIGAKSSGPNGGIELGAWGKADMWKAAYGKKDGKGDGQGLYNPVMLRDKRTGEMVSEEELRLRKLEALEGLKDRAVVRSGESDNERRRRRSRSEDRERRTRDKDGYRERSRDQDRRRENHRDRDRSRDHGHREKNARSHKDYEDDSSDRYDRDKERDRRKRYIDGDRYDLSSSRRSHKDRKRESDRNGHERRHRHRDDRDDYDEDREGNRGRKEEVH